MHRVHHNIQTPHQCSGSSSNLDSQHNGSIPHVAAQVERFGNTHIQVEAKGAEVDKGDHTAMQTPLPAPLEFAGRYSSCIKDGVLSNLFGTSLSNSVEANRVSGQHTEVLMMQLSNTTLAPYQALRSDSNKSCTDVTLHRCRGFADQATSAVACAG